ncbi:MAG: pyruvate kinase [Ignavibacteria bacterium]|nr:pyruvate kinase [Ignavibacteria bacterium]
MKDTGLTKMVCTIGPASQDVEMLIRLINAGMSAARLNFSHGTHDQHRTMIENIREASRRTGEVVTLVQDLSGPKIRTGRLKTSFVDLIEDERIVFTTDEIVGDRSRVTTTYKRLPKDVRRGDTILVDDGRIKLVVESTEETEVTCRIVNGGRLTEKKGMNLPGVRVSVESFTEKDIDDLKFGMEHDIDYVALSFVRSVEDLRSLHEVIVRENKTGEKIPIIAKIEKREAVDSLDLILEEADAVMVARGDLGVELPPEDVPPLQKMIVRKCNEAGIPVIIATQMLESMIENPRPTRAEASDVANAVLDGADAVMLSGETSVGKYPEEVVQTMGRIIRKAEGQLRDRQDLLGEGMTHIPEVFDSIARAACVLARQVRARAIVSITHSGTTAFRLSKYRPRAPIIAVTGREKIIRRVNLAWGVRGLLLPDYEQDAESVFEKIRTKLVDSGTVQKGDYVVYTAGIPIAAKETTNTITIERLE